MVVSIEELSSWYCATGTAANNGHGGCLRDGYLAGTSRLDNGRGGFAGSDRLACRLRTTSFRDTAVVRRQDSSNGGGRDSARRFRHRQITARTGAAGRLV